jgi:hypothetical protein
MRIISKQVLITFLGLLALTSLGRAQEKEVSGKVLDAQSITEIPGVNIIIKGTTKGVITNLDGEFTIEASPSDTLEISFLGYNTEKVFVGDQSYFNVSLIPSIELLNEVVVVGYGKQRKSDLTGATISLKGEELNHLPVLSATQALQGKAAGVQIINSGAPGSSPNVPNSGNWFNPGRGRSIIYS